VARSDAESLRAQRGEAQGLADLLQPVRDSLESLRRSAERAGIERTAAEATITTQIAAVQERYQSLEAATAQLAAALARGQTRGQWGEMQLEALLEHAGLLEGTHYTRQDVRSGPDGGTRPDIVVHLPGGGEVLVDAKFPFDAYWEALGSDDPHRRDELMRKHAADVLLRARELSSKRYSDSSRSPDFVVMFLPLESLLSASLEADGLLLEKTFERKVVLASPTTMLALLRTIAFGYQRQLMADNAEQIRAAGAEMLTRLGILVEHVEVMRRGLDQAVRGYNSFVGSLDRQAMRQARRLHEPGVESTRSLESPAVIDVALREPEPRALG
jgi:DNA recombination protein RmuC